jgi:hypothetical protein
MRDPNGSRPATGSRHSRSYLLRLWQEGPESPWRAMLRCVTSKERLLFHDIEGLVAFLKAEMGETPETTETK